MRKHSRQRDAILENLMNRYDHPTADRVYASLKPDYPKLSLGTVYRNLSLLVDEGAILKISCGDGTEHYDGHTADHGHFVCRKCGRLVDLFLPEDSQSVRSSEIGKIESRTLIYYGECKNCLKNNKTKKEK